MLNRIFFYIPLGYDLYSLFTPRKESLFHKTKATLKGFSPGCFKKRIICFLIIAQTLIHTYKHPKIKLSRQLFNSPIHQLFSASIGARINYLKTSNFSLFGQIWTEILTKYYRDVISKVIFLSLNQTFGHL